MAVRGPHCTSAGPRLNCRGYSCRFLRYAWGRLSPDPAPQAQPAVTLPQGSMAAARRQRGAARIVAGASKLSEVRGKGSELAASCNATTPAAARPFPAFQIQRAAYRGDSRAGVPVGMLRPCTSSPPAVISASSSGGTSAIIVQHCAAKRRRAAGDPLFQSVRLARCTPGAAPG